MACGSEGVVYVSDSCEGRLRMVQLPPAGVANSVISTVRIKSGFPLTALAYDPAIRVLFLGQGDDEHVASVSKLFEPITPPGPVTSEAWAGAMHVTTDGGVGFTKITSMAVTSEGDVFVIDLATTNYGWRNLADKDTLTMLAASDGRQVGQRRDVCMCSKLTILPCGGLLLYGNTRPEDSNTMWFWPTHTKPPYTGTTHEPPFILNGAASLAADLTAMRASPSVPLDVVITTAGSRTFPAHRLVLAARCEYFARLFAGGFDDSGASDHELQDADPDAFELLLSYMYGGELRPPPALLRPLADRLLLAEASAHLQRQIVESAGPCSVVSDLVWAEQRGLAGVVAGLKDYYLRHAAEVAEEAPDSIEQLMAASPKLHLELHTALAKRARRR